MIFYGLTVRQWHYNNTKRKNSILWQCLLNLLITRLITIQMLSRPFIMFIFLVSSVSGQNEVTNYIITIKQEESAKYLCQTSSSPKREKPFNNCKQSQAWAASFLITRRLNLFFFFSIRFSFYSHSVWETGYRLTSLMLSRFHEAWYLREGNRTL